MVGGTRQPRRAVPGDDAAWEKGSGIPRRAGLPRLPQPCGWLGASRSHRRGFGKEEAGKQQLRGYVGCDTPSGG